MKSTRWVFTYIVMASVGLWLALFMSLRFVATSSAQTPPPPSMGDLPPEFAQEAAPIPPPPNEPPIPLPVRMQPRAQEQAPAADPQAQAPVAATPIPAATAPVPPASDAKAVAPVPQMEVAAPIIPQFAADDQYTYDPTGRRDPFKPYKSYRPSNTTNTGPVRVIDPTDPLQKWELDRFAVVAIMWEIRTPKAMVKDPDGKMFMVGKSTKIGRNSGQVVAIREGEVVVVEVIDNEGVQTKEVKILELKK